jgi:hypothetical protein
MGLVNRYLEFFEGEPAWLILVVSIFLLVGVIVIVEKMIKLSTWLLIAGLVAAAVIVVGMFVLYA